MRENIFTLGVLGVMGFVVSACGIHETKHKSEPTNVTTQQLDPSSSKLSFSQVYNTVIQPNCVQCHRQGRAKGGVMLDTYANVFANLEGVRQEAIVSGDMPPTGPLPREELLLLSNWISQGAPNSSEPVVDATPFPVQTPAATPAATPQPTPEGTPIPDPSPSATPMPSSSPQPSPAPVPTATPIPTPALVATFQSIHDQVFVMKCLKCHVAGGRAQDYPLDTYAGMMGAKTMVVPGDPNQGSLVSEIAAGTMPPKRAGLPPVTEEELSAIKIWITNGAKPE